ncbi:MAG: 3-phosphoshikimate 1-carboxyvinyltransferase [Planctomycetota bacterium]
MTAAGAGDARVIEPFGAPVDAAIRVPGSKSLTNRHLVLAALARGRSTLRGALASDDCDRLVNALELLGARITRSADGTVLEIEGVDGRPRGGARLDLGDGGTPSRFMLAVAALAREETIVDGSARMRERPVAEGVALLEALGARARIEGPAGGLPVAMRGAADGGLPGGAVEVGRTASSQFISALMLVAPWTARGVAIRFREEPTSASYLALSLAALAAWGVDARVAYGPTPLGAGPGAGLRSIEVPAGPPAARNLEVEPDLSSAVYPAALAALVGGRVRLEGIGRRSAQPDAWFLDDLALRGAKVAEVVDDASDGLPRGDAAANGSPSIEASLELSLESSLEVRGSGRIVAVDADYSRAPDAAVMAMVVAACADRPSRFTGLGTLRVKESDRIASVAAGLEALGGRVESGPDWAVVHPLPKTLVPATIDTARDHRIAMAFAVLGAARAGVTIARPEVVEKSWPGFWAAFEGLRGDLPPQGVFPQNAER